MTEQERKELVDELVALKAKLVSFRPRPLQPWEAEMAAAVSNADLHAIWREQRGGATERSSLAQLPQSEPRPPLRASEVPLSAPPGVDLIDRMCAQQDRIDRAASNRVFLDTVLIEAAMEQEKGARIERDYNPFSRDRMGGDDE